MQLQLEPLREIIDSGEFSAAQQRILTYPHERLSTIMDSVTADRPIRWSSSAVRQLATGNPRHMNVLHTQPIQTALLRLEDDQKALLRAWKDMIGGDGAPFFPLDLLASSVVKRAVSASAAIKVLVESWNIVSARSLLRTQLDTALRLSAAWLVENPHEFATLAISGRPINKLKDREGKPLTDARLVELRSRDLPWLPEVYENLCGHVNFSATHLFDAVEPLDEEGQINLLISETDPDFPESSWSELISCFQEGTAMLIKFVNGYAVTKQLTQEQLAAGCRKE